MGETCREQSLNIPNAEAQCGSFGKKLLDDCLSHQGSGRGGIPAGVFREMVCIGGKKVWGKSLAYRRLSP